MTTTLAGIGDMARTAGFNIGLRLAERCDPVPMEPEGVVARIRERWGTAATRRAVDRAEPNDELFWRLWRRDVEERAA